MNLRHICFLLCLLVLFVAAQVQAQVSIDWRTIDCGGGRTAGGTLTIDATIGQYDAGPGQAGMTGGTIKVVGGYWAGVPRCPADFDQSGELAVADIFAFLNAWFAGLPSADFDGINGLQVADIFAFLNAWFAGCP